MVPSPALSEFMNPKFICLLVAVGLILPSAAFGAGAKSYKITGTVVVATGSMVTVEKGADRFEIDIDPATTKGSADLKVGSTITVTYVMSATKIEETESRPASSP